MTQEMTALDRAHAAMAADGADDAARLAFYGVFADSSLVILLAEDAGADSVVPRVVETGGGSYVLAFDSDARLAEFAGNIAPYAGLSGRGLAELLAAEEVGIALNPGVAPSEYMFPPDAVSWLTRTLAHAPRQALARPVGVTAPTEMPATLQAALGRKLDGAGDLAKAAYLVRADYDDGRTGALLVFVGTNAATEPALAVAVNEALSFSGLEAGALDVTFAEADGAFANRVARVGRRLDLTKEPVADQGPVAPGMDPDRPPKLK